jgi:RNA polymerase sigma factor (sigma-70 family)
MSPQLETARIEDLLAHADWVRRLAARLVDDHDDAEDVVQETWTVAMRSPPRTDRPLQPWLATILRNLVRRRWRQRRVRERARSSLTREETAPSPDALLERARLQRALVESVVDLEEPYRSTILLRYYEGRSADEIAQQLDVAAGTVRWRLSEGIDRLRRRLDGRQSGNRKAWMGILAPMSAPLTGAARPTAALMVTRRVWLMALGTKGKIGIAALVVMMLAVGTGWWMTDGSGAHGAHPPPTTSHSAGLVSATHGNEVRAESARTRPPRFEGPVQKQFYPTHIGKPRDALTPFDLAFFNAMPKIKRCYGELLDREPDAVGHFGLRFTVVRDGYDGRVRDATIVPPKDGKAELTAPLMQQCILLALQESTFPAPSGDQEEHSIPIQFGGLTDAERARRGLPPRKTEQPGP